MNTWNNSFNNSFAAMQQLFTQTAKNIATIKNTTNSILKKLQDLCSLLKIELKNLKTAIEAQHKKAWLIKLNDQFMKKQPVINISNNFPPTNKSDTPSSNVTNNYTTKEVINKDEKSRLEKINDWLDLISTSLDILNSGLDFANGIRDLLKDIKSFKPNNKSIKYQKLKKNPKEWLPKIKKLGSSAAEGTKTAASKIGNFFTKGAGKGITSKVGNFFTKGAGKGITSKVGNFFTKGAGKRLTSGVGNFFTKGAGKVMSSRVGSLLTSKAVRKSALKVVTKTAPRALMWALPRIGAKFVPGLNLLSLGYDAYSLYKYIKKKNAGKIPAKTIKNAQANAGNIDTMTYPSILNQTNQIPKKSTAASSPTGFRDFNIAKIADTVIVREDADINRIAKIIAAKLETAKNNQGGRKSHGNLAHA